MKDNLLYVDARGLQVIYNAFMIAILWITRGWRDGHWYFDAITLTTPPNPRTHWTILFKLVRSVNIRLLRLETIGGVMTSNEVKPPIQLEKYEIRTNIETNIVFLKIILEDGNWYEMRLSLTDMVNLRRDLNKAVDHVLQNASNLIGDKYDK